MTKGTEVNKSRVAGSLLATALAGLALLQTIDAVSRWREFVPARLGEAAPGFVLPLLGDEGAVVSERTLLDYSGQVVILDFWATWCGPCRQSMPALERVAQKFSQDDVAILSINIEGDAARPQAWAMVRERNPSAVPLLDDGSVAVRYSVINIPHIVVVGRDGRVATVHRNFASASTLQRELSAAVLSAL